MRVRDSIRRVLMTADTVGGVWTYAMDLARGLRTHGVEVSLATMGEPLSRQQAEEAAQVGNVEVFESRYKLEWMDDPWSDVSRAGDWLLALENDISPDLVHLNGYAHGSLPWRAPHLVVGHSCVLSWWRAVKTEAAPAEWARYRFVVTSGLRGADFIIAPTRAMMADLESHYGPFRRTAVVANARSATDYSPGLKGCFILAAGRLWDEAKNISALSRVRQSVDWPIYVAGDSHHPNGKAPSLDRLRLLGRLRQRDLANYYAKAAIYCLPAKYEPFGLSVLEAAFSGCALVLGDIPSLRENWDGAAVFVGPDDLDALEWHLRALIANQDYRGKLATRARRRAARFTLERMTASYLSVYSQLLQKEPLLAMAGD